MAEQPLAKETLGATTGHPHGSQKQRRAAPAELLSGRLKGKGQPDRMEEGGWIS